MFINIINIILKVTIIINISKTTVILNIKSQISMVTTLKPLNFCFKQSRISHSNSLWSWLAEQLSTVSLETLTQRTTPHPQDSNISNLIINLNIPLNNLINHGSMPLETLISLKQSRTKIAKILTIIMIIQVLLLLPMAMETEAVCQENLCN